MGLHDEVSKLSGSGGGLGGNSALLTAVLQMLGPGDSGGGLANIIQGLQRAGLGDAVSSWVSTGQNLPVSAEQLQQGLGAARMQQLAQAAGMTESATAGVLSGLLPAVVDRLTPKGALPQWGQLPQLLASVKVMLGA